MTSPDSAEAIGAGLRKLRRIRNLSHGPMAAFALLVLVEMLASPPLSDSANSAANIVLPFAFAGFVLGFWLRRRRCPRCGRPFFQTRHRFGSGRVLPVWNEFSSKCLNCGLHIDGRDA